MLQAWNQMEAMASAAPCLREGKVWIVLGLNKVKGDKLFFTGQVARSRCSQIRTLFGYILR